jgi:hypothetical protein
MYKLAPIISKLGYSWNQMSCYNFNVADDSLHEEGLLYSSEYAPPYQLVETMNDVTNKYCSTIP